MPVHPAEAFAGLDRDLLATDPDVVAGYVTDEATPTGTGTGTGAHGAVLLPRTTDDVATMLAIAHNHGIPLVTRGAGSGLSGGATAPPAGDPADWTSRSSLLMGWV